MWPFRRKADTPTGFKSASYFLTLGLGKAGLTGAGYDRLAAEGYASCVVAFACINKVAASVASVDLHLYRRGKGGKLAKVEDHALLDLIENPNPAQSGREFMRQLTSYSQLCGNGYVFGNGIDPSRRNGKPPQELQLLNPGKMKVEPGPGLFPKQYEYRPNQNAVAAFPVDPLSGRSAVLHLKSFNPLNAWYGMSPLEAAALGVDIHNDGQKWNKRLIENGARPSGALVVQGSDGKPATLGEDQYVRLKEMIDEQFSGPTNAGRPMLLEGGLDWKEMSLNPRDMEFLEGKHSAARDIALAFGVPPQLLGIPGDSTYCLPFNARVSTPSGPIKIGEIKSGNLVYSFDSGSLVEKPVTWAGKVGTKQTYRVSLTNRDIVATGNHPLLVRRDHAPGQARLEYVQVDDLVPGDIVVIAHRLPDRTSDAGVTSEHMELFGFYTGDGSSALAVAQAEARGYRRGGFVSLAIPRGASYGAYYSSVLSQAADGNTLVHSDRDIRVSSTALSKRLSALGLVGTAKTKRVPTWVFQTSKDHRLAYLRGILDSDGSVDKNGRMSLALCNLDLVTDIWHLALSCGLRVGRIWSEERTNKLPNGTLFTGMMHGFMISSAESVAEIGTRTPEYLSRIAANLGKERFLHHWYETGGAANREAATSLIDAEYLSYARVLNVVAEEVCDVYDIEVEGTHNFVADGVVVHNSNYSEAKLAFWTDTVLSQLGWTLDAFNRWLTPLYGEDLFLWYDEEMIPALEPLRKEKAERINNAAYMTINEKRRAMGLDDVEGGDVIFVPSTSIPLELAGQVDLPEPGSETDPAKPNPEDDPDAND